MSSPSKKLKLVYQEREENHINPMLASFPLNVPQGLIKQLTQDGQQQEEKKEQFKFELYKNEEDKLKKKQRILQTQNEKIEWIGKNFGEFSEKLQTQKYLIGIKDSKTSQIKLFDVQNLFQMQQHKFDSIDDDSLQKDNNISLKLNALDKKKLLVQEFGTSKSKKKLAQMLQNQVEENNIQQSLQMEKDFNEKADIIEEDIKQLQQNDKQADIEAKKEFLPEFNLDTAIVDKIYNINSIISQDEWQQLDADNANTYIKKKSLLNQNRKLFSQFIYQIFMNFDSIKKSGGYFQKIKQLLYLDIMIKFCKMQAINQSIEEISNQLNVNQIFVKNILSRYYQKIPISEDKIKYVRLTDKYFCHLLVLALFAFDFQFDAADLTMYLKQTPQKIIQYFKEIGCTINLKENKNVESDQQFNKLINVKLEAPLKLQFNVQKKGKKGKK